jgi:hypothetical protein
MGPIICAQAWTEDNQPIGSGTEFSGCIKEITCRWNLINPNGEQGTTKWELNGERRCQHPTELPPDATWDGSSWVADGECMLPGTWCVLATIAGQEMNRTCFTITEETPAPSMSQDLRIDSIDFPDQVSADGTSAVGTIRFTAPNGISYVYFNVVDASDFSSFGFDPRDYITEGDVTQGAFDFHIWCAVPQDVTLRGTLYDVNENSSPPVDFSFSCR